ncbi:MAG TPA: LON peptidase substrate-binding domain-containing protein [Gaiellaceae bacterium]
MPELGLFPLGLVLLPTERVPLHIFEDRYRELIGECVELEREFGLLYADDEGLREVGCRAAVLEVLEQFDDGRMNIVVEGRERFRIVQHTSGRSFSTAEVEPLGDDERGIAPEAAARALNAFQKLVEIVEAEVELPDPLSPQLSYELAGRVEFEAEAKQELLESRSESKRLERVAELLESAAATVALTEEARKRASSNGKVSPP